MEQKQVQTEFTVKLMAFDEKQKVALIKEVKNLLPDTNLVQVNLLIFENNKNNKNDSIIT